MGFEKNFKIEREKPKDPELPDEKINLRRREFTKAAGGLLLGMAAGGGIVKAIDAIKSWDEKPPGAAEGQEEPLSDKKIGQTSELKEKKKKEPVKENNAKVNEGIFEKEKAELLVREAYRLYEKEEMRKRRPEDRFTDNFYIAHQSRETGYKKKAVSSVGAKGIYQNMPISVKDVAMYLTFLRKNNIVDYRGPENIKDITAEKITDYFSDKGNLGRIFGKLYLQSLNDPNFIYKKYNYVFKNLKNPKDIQRRLLAGYYGGPKQMEKGNWAPQIREYVDNVMGDQDKLNLIKIELDEIKFKGDENYAAMLVLKKINSVDSKIGQRIFLKESINRLKEAGKKYSNLDQQKLNFIF
jgi:hypothetical protein